MDNRVVLDVIKECVLDTAAETWIKNLKCGRTAMKALHSYYDGLAEGREGSLQQSRHWRNCFTAMSSLLALRSMSQH